MANDNFWLGVMIGNLFSKKGNNGEQKGGCLGKIIGILVIIGIGNLAIKYYGIKGILIPIAILIKPKITASSKFIRKSSPL